MLTFGLSIYISLKIMEHQQENQDNATAPTYIVCFIKGLSRGFKHPQSFNKLFN